MNVIVCGGRNYSNVDYLNLVLTTFHQDQQITRLAHGNAIGADTLAGFWAKINNILVKEYPVSKEDWERFGRRAGNVRNALMLECENPSFLIAFPGGDGTADMVHKARIALVPIFDVKSSKVIRPPTATPIVDLEEILRNGKPDANN